MQQYTAKLTGNRRDITSCPKALLLNITDENSNIIRDHMWVELTNSIDRIQPLGHQKPKEVIFTAKQKEYMKRGEKKLTFEIQEIKKNR